VEKEVVSGFAVRTLRSDLREMAADLFLRREGKWKWEKL